MFYFVRFLLNFALNGFGNLGRERAGNEALVGEPLQAILDVPVLAFRQMRRATHVPERRVGEVRLGSAPGSHDHSKALVLHRIRSGEEHAKPRRAGARNSPRGIEQR